ncbi:hypothetical protein [Mycobacterium sp. GA-1199]|uniref:hypothetical protein n=1 Tax=Mycobacterium sp. GA-1199 TaxID=1772287 RepID=UPI000B0BC0F7|nr:hypothetical protein [Mycobacterium sp. GA-1199]
MMDAEIVAAIRARAKELADAAPPLTTEQAALLISLVRRHQDPPTSAGDAA